jgi:hypothetical protein
MSLKNDVTNWIKLDKQIEQYKNVIKTLKQNRISVEDKIMNVVSSKNLYNSELETNGNTILIKKTETTGNLSMKLIKEVLIEELEHNEKYVEFLINKINTAKNKDKKISYSIKRKS